MNTNATQTVRSAIASTAAATNLGDHWPKLLASRAGLANPSGSFVPGVTSEELLSRLNAADWEEFQHQAIQAPAKGFVTHDVTGKVGLVALSSLAPATPVRLVDGHATGFLSVLVKGGKPTDADFTVLLIGPGEGDNAPDIVWTFHPGEPVRPSSLKVEAVSGTDTTAAEAIKLGFDLGKIEV